VRRFLDLLDEPALGHRCGFAGVAWLARRDEVVCAIMAAVFSRDDVIDDKEDVGGGRTAVAARVLIAPQHLVADALGDGHVPPPF
jgi:hypothetical protein